MSHLTSHDDPPSYDFLFSSCNTQMPQIAGLCIRGQRRCDSCGDLSQRRLQILPVENETGNISGVASLGQPGTSVGQPRTSLGCRETPSTQHVMPFTRRETHVVQHVPSEGLRGIPLGQRVAALTQRGTSGHRLVTHGKQHVLFTTQPSASLTQLNTCGTQRGTQMRCQGTSVGQPAQRKHGFFLRCCRFVHCAICRK